MNEREKKISVAVKQRHAATAPEITSERMRSAALARWSRVSKEDRRAHALKMVLARIDKNDIDKG
jgi:hypothetical protein